jgi:hypothetical protein
LSDEAGAALLRDNSVWGTDRELKATTHDFAGHPLALGLLASFLKETQKGDVRRRDHIRHLLADADIPGHDHARRVMESYEKEWLSHRPILLAIMHIVGLFDRPASNDCLLVLREYPPISGLPESISDLSDQDWRRAIARLREVRLLAPAHSLSDDALDAHPLVREWFGERFRQDSKGGWRTAQSRLYQHLRDTTREGKTPPLEHLAPLYQAISHGCRAGLYKEALDEIYRDRICRREIGPNRALEYYATRKLGAAASDLAAVSWFFDKPYETPVAVFKDSDQIALLGIAAFCLRAQGRLGEALQAQYGLVSRLQSGLDWKYGGTHKFQHAAERVISLSKFELLAGDVSAAHASALRSAELADRSKSKLMIIASRLTLAYALQAKGQKEAAEKLLDYAEEEFRKSDLNYKPGHLHCELLLAKTDWVTVLHQAKEALVLGKKNSILLITALHTLVLGRANFMLLLQNLAKQTLANEYAHARTSRSELDDSINRLRASGSADYIPCGLLARASFHRSTGDFDGAARDLDEVEEISEPGPMRLFLCDMTLERARLAFAKTETFAPLNSMLEKDNPPKPAVPSAEEIAELKSEAEKQLKIAAEYVEKCGYHRRDEELAELQAVLRGEKRLADLPPRV